MRLPHIIIGTMAAALVALGVVRAQSEAPAAPAAAAAVAGLSQKAELRTAMRELWADDATFTRNEIISIVANLPDVDTVSARLLKNQEDIGNALKPFYGADAATRLTGLLKDRVALAVEAVKTARAGDKTRIATAQKKWSDNGKQIADFLAGANPNWDKAAMQQVMQKHVDLTAAEATSRLAKNWAADIKAYDAGHNHLLSFADTLADGIAKQFPGKFTS
jgi:hypothetical protein